MQVFSVFMQSEATRCAVGRGGQVAVSAALIGACVAPTLERPASAAVSSLPTAGQTMELAVHSAYPRALNLQPVTGLRFIISLISDPADMAPNAILLHPPSGGVSDRPSVGVRGRVSQRAPEGEPWSLNWEAAVTVGERCLLDESRLVIPARRTRVTVLLHRAARWEGRLPEDSRFEVTEERLRVLRDLLQRQGRPGGMLGVVCPAFDGPVSRFARKRLAAGGNGSERKSDAVIDLSPLVGLGIGLTPSGDDFIAGVLLAQQLLRSASPTACAVLAGTVDSEAVRRRLAATTPAGATLLSAALAGRFPAYLLELCRRFFAAGSVAGSRQPKQSGQHDQSGQSGQHDQSGQSDQLGKHGATSATDAVAGLLWRLSEAGENLVANA